MLKKHFRKSQSKTRFDLQPTNREGVFTFRPPPEGFDPLTASPRALRQRGILLRRPDPAKEPHLYNPWTRILGKMAIPSAYDVPVKFVPRSLAPIPGRGGPRISHGDSTWAGSQVPGHWVGVFATWHVPPVTIPAALNWPSSPQELRSSSWVGLSGVGIGQATPILQAGVDHVIDATGKISYLSWVEWYPNLSNYFGLPVSAGDQIAVAIQLVASERANVGAPAPPPGPYQYGGVNFVNLTTGKVQTLYLPPPPPPDPPASQAFVELNAEWIVEIMTSFLTKFTPITFDACGSCNAGGSVVGKPSQGTITNLEFNGVPQTTTAVTDTTVTITDLEP